MPKKAKKYCVYPGCIEYALLGRLYCAKHAKKLGAERDRHRLSPSKRGYDRQWRKLRIRILREHGIPKDQWPLYDVDHDPPYDPEMQPDHRYYNLIPRLHADHSRKTVKYDGGFGRKKARGGGD